MADKSARLVALGLTPAQLGEKLPARVWTLPEHPVRYLISVPLLVVLFIIER
jgi:hypothetical protein